MRTLGFFKQEQLTTDKSLLGRLFEFIGLSDLRFNHKGSQNGLSLKDLSLSRTEEESLKGNLLVDMPSRGSLLHPEADVKEFELQRNRITQILAAIQPRQRQAASFAAELQKIDPVYLSPIEKGQIINTLLSELKPNEVPGAAFDQVLASLFTSPFSENARAKEFLSQVSAEQLVRLREEVKCVQKNPASGITPNPTDDSAYDGAFIGCDGAGFRGITPLSKIPPIMPANTSDFEAEKRSPIVLINGVNMRAASHAESMQDVANEYGVPVVGVHNSKLLGLANEFSRAKDDAHNVRRNPTINTVRDLVLGAVYRNEKLTLIAVSHGANIVSRALQRVKSILRQEGMSSEEFERNAKCIDPITFGGACWEYPDGYSWKHFVLAQDQVPFHFGLTPSVLSTAEIRHTKKLHKKNKGASFKGVATFRLLVGLKIKNPLLHPGKGAKIFVLDRKEPTHLDPDPHSIRSYIRREREQKLLSFGAVPKGNFALNGLDQQKP